MFRLSLPSTLVWLLVAAGFSPITGAAEGETEFSIVVVDDAPIHDARTGKSLGTLMRGTSLYSGPDRTVYRTHTWPTHLLSIQGESILPENAALKLFDERIAAAPSAADYADRASIHFRNERYVEAEIDLDRALKLDPKLYRAYLRRAECYPWTAFEAAIRDPDILTRRFELALKDADKCLELRPNEFLSHLCRFQVLTWPGDLRAIPEGVKALELRPDFAPILSNSAKLLVDVGRWDEALVMLNRALEIDPEYSNAYTNRGIIFHHRRQFDRAIDDATQAIKYNPLNTSAWSNRGNAHMDLQKWDKAIEDFSEFIRLTPDSADGYFARANVYFARGNQLDAAAQPSNVLLFGGIGRMGTESFRKALDDCNAAIKRHPRDYKSFNTKGNLLKKLDRPEDAIATFDAAIREIEKEAREGPVRDAQGRLHDLGDAVEKTLQFADHPETFDEATQQTALGHPQHLTIGAILGNRADAYRMLFQDPRNPDPLAGSKMLADVTRAIYFDSENPHYHRVRGYFHLEFKNWDKALADLTRAEQLQPNYADAIRGRILANLELKNFDDAWSDAKRLEQLGSPLDATTLDRLKKASGRP